MLFNLDKSEQCAKVSAYIAFNKATYGQTDIKHDNDEHLAQCVLMHFYQLTEFCLFVLVMRFDTALQKWFC